MTYIAPVADEWHYCPTDGIYSDPDEVERGEISEHLGISLMAGVVLAMTGSLFVAGVVGAWVVWELFAAQEDFFIIVPAPRQID